MGEHDYYLDLGEYWSELFGPHYYSWDHKGVHFVVLNSILTYDEWTHERWPTAEQRMLEMAGLDNPNGSPFMVGEKQREWLAEGPREGQEGHAGRRLLALADPEDLQGLELLDRGRREVQACCKPFDDAPWSTATSTRSSTTRSATSASTR